MDTLNSRLKILIEKLGYGSNRSFDKALDVPETQTASITGPKQSMPNSNYIIKLALKFPQVDLRWLMVGEGEMFKPSGVKNGDIVEELERLKQENTLLRNELQGSRFALSLVAQNSNFQSASNFKFVSSKKPVNQRVGIIIQFVADSTTDSHYSTSVIA